MRSRDEAEFAEFVRARASVMLRLCILLTGDRLDGEDLLQTGLIRVCRRWAHVQDNPEGYLRKVLVNLARDRRRSLARRPHEVLATAERPASTDVGADLPDQLVLAALRKLPLRQRKTVVLRFWCDFSVDQVAEALGCSVGTVKSQTSKAIAALRNELGSMSTLTGADHHE